MKLLPPNSNNSIPLPASPRLTRLQQLRCDGCGGSQGVPALLPPAPHGSGGALRALCLRLPHFLKPGVRQRLAAGDALRWIAAQHACQQVGPKDVELRYRLR